MFFDFRTSMSLVHRSCLHVLHCLVDLVTTLWNFMAIVLTSFLPTVDSCLNGKPTKIPNHLAFFANEYDSNVSDFARIVSFAYNYGVKTVTIYDPHRCYYRQTWAKLGNNSKISDSAPIRLHLAEMQNDNDQLQAELIGEKTEFTRDIEVLLYDSKSGGHHSLVSICREICANVANKSLSADQVNVEMVRKLHVSRGLNEPDCLLIFAPSYTTAGFCPWTLRLTELYLADSLRDFDKKKFLKAMRICGNRQQRCGR